jgi:cystathionine gamma-lyase
VNEPGPHDYSRTSNPTRAALESCLAALEGGSFGFAFASGMAAETTLLSAFGGGDHIIFHRDLYSGTHRLLTAVLANKNILFDFVDLSDLDAIRAAVRPTTKAIWIESPTNPCMRVVDLEAIAGVAKEHGLLTMCDNTFASPYFQRPLDYGIDVVVHSTTKYLNGHSDVIGGALVLNDPEFAKRIAFLQNAMGAVAAPFDCFLVLRGIKTLPVRMEEHNSNALTIAKWLQQHAKVSEVLHPGLESHPQYDLARKQMSGYGGTFSFRVRGAQDEAFRFLGALKLFTIAQSLGGVQSLIAHPVTMTHKWLPPEMRQDMGITEELIRISVGLEDVEDLRSDLDAGLAEV